MSDNPPTVTHDDQEKLINRVETARQSGSTFELISALSALGYHHLREQVYAEGIEIFDEAITLAKSTHDLEEVVSVLGLKALALQETNNHTDAFEVVTEALSLAKEAGHQGIECDSLSSIASILTEKGEHQLAFRHATEALALAEKLDDKRRLMNVLGLIGHLNINLAAIDQALLYFGQAADLAHETGNSIAEYGYLSNKASALMWMGRDEDAISLFDQVSMLARTREDRDAEMNACMNLVKLHSKARNTGELIACAGRGLTLAREMRHTEAVFYYFEALIVTLIKAYQMDTARKVITDAIDYAQSEGLSERELSMLINLGEIDLVTGMLNNAFKTYEKARSLAIKLGMKDEAARLTGRMGAACGEMARTEEARQYHLEAITLAKQEGLPELEGEQYSLLAMTLQEEGKPDEAADACRRAIEIFEAAGLKTEKTSAENLLLQLTGQ